MSPNEDTRFHRDDWCRKQTVYTYTLITEFVEDARTFVGRNKADNLIPTPNSCAACGAEQRNHAYSWVNRQDGSGEFHRYEAPSNALRLARMRARTKH